MRLKRERAILCSAFVFVFICVAYASLVSFTSDESIEDFDVTEKHPVDLDVRQLDVPIASKQTPRRSLRLALCVSGALRSLANERQRINFVDTFYKPFEPNDDGINVSATVHTLFGRKCSDKRRKRDARRRRGDQTGPYRRGGCHVWWVVVR